MVTVCPSYNLRNTGQGKLGATAARCLSLADYGQEGSAVSQTGSTHVSRPFTLLSTLLFCFRFSSTLLPSALFSQEGRAIAL